MQIVACMHCSKGVSILTFSKLFFHVVGKVIVKEWLIRYSEICSL